jgi:hypothetical protein
MNPQEYEFTRAVHQGAYQPANRIESLWWPLDADVRGDDLRGRPAPEAWRDDLRKVGLRAGETVWFLSEDVIARFDLRIHQNGEASYPITRVPNGACVTSDEGHCALSIPDLVDQCDADGQRDPWRYPLSYRCRVGVSARVNMRLVYRDDALVFAVEGGAL